MTLAVMRYVLENAGNIDRLHLAVKASNAVSRDNRNLQWEAALRSLPNASSERAQGLRKPRSFEPDLSLARDLDFLERGGRWLVTIGPGRAFLTLWDQLDKRPPTLLIIAQLLRHDRTFLIPFLERALGQHPRNAAKVAVEIWSMLWREHKREMALAEPPVSRTIKARTGLAFARGRLRLLLGSDGLGLDEGQANRLVEQFSPFASTPLPDDAFLRISVALYREVPQELKEDSLSQQIAVAFQALRGAPYVSSLAAFAIANELNLPLRGVAWNHFVQFLRSNVRYSLHSGFKRDDLLFTILRSPVTR